MVHYNRNNFIFCIFWDFYNTRHSMIFITTRIFISFYYFNIILIFSVWYNIWIYEIHISDDLAKEWGVVDDEPVGVIIDGEKKGLVEAFFKTSSDGYLEIHLDTDDANGFLLKQNDTVEIRFKKKD